MSDLVGDQFSCVVAHTVTIRKEEARRMFGYESMNEL